MIEAESAFRTITIQVTQEDIDNGIRHTLMLSPVARAITRHLAEGAHVIVYADLITLIHNAELFDVRPPPSVVRFNHLFDQGIEVVPFSFRLELPKWFLRRE